MSFSPVWRGERIQLRDDNTIARRTESYNGGIVYSAEPLDIGEVFTVRMDAMEKGWAGSLKFGITSRDPAGQSVPKGILELYNRADFWVLSGNKLHHDHSEQSYPGPSLESLNNGDTVGLYVSEEGALHYIMKGDDKGPAIRGIPTDVPLFVVADIYGQAKQISIVGMTNQDVVMIDVEPEVESFPWPSLGASVAGNSFGYRAEMSSEEESDDEYEDDEDEDSDDDSLSSDGDGRTG